VRAPVTVHTAAAAAAAAATAGTTAAAATATATTAAAAATGTHQRDRRHRRHHRRRRHRRRLRVLFPDNEQTDTLATRDDRRTCVKVLLDPVYAHGTFSDHRQLAVAYTHNIFFGRPIGRVKKYKNHKIIAYFRQILDSSDIQF
jgi:Ni/Co efflux regulator RcnB